MSKDTRIKASKRITVKKAFAPSIVFFLGLLSFLILPELSVGYYVGPEVGRASGETRLVKTRGAVQNATSLAEAAYVPEINAIGSGIIEFLRSIVPALQPKVDFFAEQIQDTIDIANTKLMQKLENSNNGIIAVEKFFNGLFKAVVLGKGPEDEERRRRLAMSLIRSGMLANITTGIATATTASTIMKLETTSSTSRTSTSTTTGKPEEEMPTTTDITVLDGDLSSAEDLVTVPAKARDNNFNKMKVIKLVSNML